MEVRAVLLGLCVLVCRGDYMRFKLFPSRYTQCQSGSSAVEFAFVAPVLMLLCVGLMDFGMVIYEKMRLENMAHASVDYLINGGNDDGVRTDIINAYASVGTRSESGYQADDIGVDINLQCECNDGTSVNCSLSDQCSADGGYRRRFYSISVTKAHETFLPYLVIPQRFNLEGDARLQMD